MGMPEARVEVQKLEVERLEAQRLAQLVEAYKPGALERVGLDAQELCLGLMEGAQLEGGLVLSHLAFDSEVFGAKIGRLRAAFAPHSEGYELLYAEVLRGAHELGYQQLLRTVATEQAEEIAALERSDFKMVDVSVTLCRELRDLPSLSAPGDAMIRPATDGDIELLVESCATVYRKSYLYRDPFYEHAAADELHRRWLRNCHHEGRADEIFVALVDSLPVGYIACFVDRHTGRGVIDLLGVAERYRRHGLAGRLINASLEFFAERAREVRVKTQLINYGAIALYQRLGFLLCQSDVTFTRSRTQR